MYCLFVIFFTWSIDLHRWGLFCRSSDFENGTRQTEVISFPGININQLAYKIDKGHLVLDKKVVILHVEKMETWAILSAFNNLISSIRRKSDPMIVISSILQRP